MTEEQIQEMAEEVGREGISGSGYKGHRIIVEDMDDGLALFSVGRIEPGGVIPAIRAAVVMIDHLESASQQADAPFEPVAEGWEPGSFFSWISPSGTWRCIDGRSPFALEKRGVNGRWDRVYSPDSRDTPTRALVMTIIEQNGGGA